MSECFDDIVKRIRSIVDDDDLVFVYVYGSQARGDTHPRSDVDICVHVDCDDDAAFDVEKRLQGAFGEDVDVSVFQLLPLYVQASVFDGELLHAEDRGVVHDVAYATRREYESFKPRYECIVRGKAGLEVSL